MKLYLLRIAQTQCHRIGFITSATSIGVNDVVSLAHIALMVSHLTFQRGIFFFENVARYNISTINIYCDSTCVQQECIELGKGNLSATEEKWSGSVTYVLSYSAPNIRHPLNVSLLVNKLLR